MYWIGPHPVEWLLLLDAFSIAALFVIWSSIMFNFCFIAMLCVALRSQMTARHDCTVDRILHDCRSASLVNQFLVTDPSIRQPSFDLSRRSIASGPARPHAVPTCMLKCMETIHIRPVFVQKHISNHNIKIWTRCRTLAGHDLCYAPYSPPTRSTGHIDKIPATAKSRVHCTAFHEADESEIHWLSTTVILAK